MAERKIVIEREKDDDISKGPSVPISNPRETEKKEDIPESRERRPRPTRSSGERAEIKKETFGSKFKKAWFGGDVENAGDYMIFEVGVPALKATLADMLNNGVQILLFGQADGKRSMGRSAAQAGYNAAYRVSREREREEDIRRSRRSSDVGPIWEQVEPMSKSFANSVLQDMRDRADRDDYCTVGDLLYYLGFKESDIKTEDEEKCWYKEDLRSDMAGIMQVRGGWQLDLPRPRRNPDYRAYSRR